MEAMSMKERLLKALKREAVDMPPAVIPTQNAIVEIMEKSGYRWPAAQKKGKEMVGLAWACHEIGGMPGYRHAGGGICCRPDVRFTTAFRLQT